MKLTKRKAGHDEGTMICPVGDTINGPASLNEINVKVKPIDIM